MDYGALIPGLIFGFLGAAIIVWCIVVWIRAIAGDPSGMVENWRLKRKKRRLAEADALLERGSADEAMQLLRGAFALERYRRSSRALEESSQLHLSILSRLLTVADARSRRITNLPVLEDLFQTRYQLLKLYRDTVISMRVGKKRREQRKNVPRWAASQFGEKLRDLDDRIDTNRRSLEMEIGKLFAAIEEPSGGQDISIH